MSSRILLAIVAGLLFLLGWILGKDDSTTSLESQPPLTLTTASSEDESGEESAASLIARIESTQAAELGGLYDELSSKSWSSLESLSAYRGLLKRIVREDLDGFLAKHPEFLQFGSEFGRDFIREWLAVDPNGFFVRLRDSALTETPAMRVYASEVAPREFLRIAATRSDRPSDWNSSMGTAIYLVAEESPREALALLDSLDLPENTSASRSIPGANQGYGIESIHAEVAALLAKEDPEAAMAWARERTTPEGRKQTFVAVLAKWAMISPEAAATAFREMSDQAGVSFEVLGTRMAREDREQAIRWLDQYGEGNPKAGFAINRLAEGLTEPETIIKIGQQLSDDTARSKFRSAMLGSWNDRSPEEGLRWALEGTIEEQAKNLASLGKGLYQRYFEEAMVLSTQIEEPALREKFTESLQKQLAETDPVRVIELVRATDDRDRLVKTIQSASKVHAYRSDFSPEEVYAWTRIVDGEGIDAWTYTDLADRYYRDQPTEAEAWVNSLDESEEKAELMKGLTKAMASASPEKATDWAERIADPEDRDLVLRSVVESLARTNPERALTVAAGLKSSAERTWSVRLSLQNLAKRNPTAARSVLARTAGLSEKERRRLETWIYAPE
jgi:hypothetical protein